MPAVHAAQWSLSGSVDPSLEYDDNIFMRDTNKIGDYHSRMSPTLSAAYNLENMNVSFNTGYVVDRYDESSELNTENPFWRFNTQYQTQRSSWGLGVSYQERTSRSLAADNTGDFETNSINTSETIAPSFSYQLTERDVLGVRGSYVKQESSTVDFSDSKSRSLTTSWTHKFTERLNGGVALTVSNNKSTGLASSSDDDTYNLSLTSQYEMSEIWSINGSVGIRQLDSEQKDAANVTSNGSTTGSSLNVNVSYKKDVDTASIGVSRSISPSIDGGVNEIDKFSINWSRDLSDVLSTSIRASIQQTSSARVNSSDKRENISVSPAINLKLSPDASIALTYRYRQQKESVNDTRVSSNAVMLTFNYNWDGFSVSR